MKEILTKEEKKLHRKQRWSKFKATCKKGYTNRKKIGIVALVLIIVISVLYVWLFVYKSEPEVTTEQLNTMLSESSELTSAKLNGRAYSIYEDDGIPIINKRDFMMIYKYTVRAGFDVKEVEPNINHVTKTITIEIPKSRVLDVKVEPKSIEFYDEDFTLFNVDEGEDVLRAQSAAEMDVFEQCSESGILEYADSNSETLVKGMISGVVPKDYKVKTIIVDK